MSIFFENVGVQLRGWVAIALAMTGCVAGAGDITVDRRECAPTIHLRARGATLSEVLQKLGESQGFEVRFETSRDPGIDVDVSASAGDIVARLTRFQSVIMSRRPDPHCSGQARLTRVWVLPQGKEAPRTIEARVSVMPPPPPLDPEAKRRQDEGIRMYERAHGMTMSEPDPH